EFRRVLFRSRDGTRRGAAGVEERRCPWSEGMAVGVRETRQDTMERDEIFNVKRRTQPMTNKGGAERANYEQLRDLSVLRDRPGVAELADLRSPAGRPRDPHRRARMDSAQPPALGGSRLAAGDLPHSLCGHLGLRAAGFGEAAQAPE